MKTKRNKGIAIEYVIVAMALMAALISVILSCASFGNLKAKEYTKYLDRKNYLDNVAREFISKDLQEDELDALAENEFGYVARVVEVAEGDNDIDLVVVVGEGEGERIVLEVVKTKTGTVTKYEYGDL